MAQTTNENPVLQLRLVVEAADFEQAVAFYRDTLGLSEQAAFEGDGEERVVILDAGRATLELANPAQKRMIDAIEAEGRPSPRLRVAFEVRDSEGVTRRLVEAGATLVSPPVETPWRSLNSRLDAPAGLQVTLFEELETLEQRTERPGFGTDATREE
jgi:catechol 2,3-dioxygenase-like lactoylglutathione lyase family enzyme